MRDTYKSSFRSLILVISSVAALTLTLSAGAVVVTGTGDPNVDVPAVQGAVDQGGRVILRGQFSFDRPPTAPAGAIYKRMVTASRNVVISGGRDAAGDLPTIAGGEWPFLVDAVDAHVTIEGLRFVRPRAGAIWVYAVSGLAVTGCRIESIEATAEFAMQSGQASPVSDAIFVGSDPHPGAAAQPKQPGNFSGTLAILNNDIDVGGARGTQSLGIVMFSVGRSPDKEVEIYVSANNIRNTTEPAINLRYIGGRAHLERNVVITGAVNPLGTAPDAIRVAGSGSYLIAHNSVDCGWADGAAVGINVFGLSAALEASAIVMDNDVTMSAPVGTAFGPNSAAIEIKGFARGNSVLNNRIRGRASAALAVITQTGGTPESSSFVSNDLDGFQSSLGDIFVDAGVTNTVVIGRQASVENRGIGTVVVPMP